MRKRQFPLLAVLVITLVIACVPESKKLLTVVAYNSKDALFQRITDYQHNGNTDSLLLELKSKNPTARFLAARAFASHNDPKSLDSLYTLLNDPIVKVRAMSAYAIGQQRNPSSEQPLIRGFRQKDTMSVDNSGNATILEAIGKLSGAPLAKYIASADGYRSTDTLLYEGQMKSLFQFAFRDVTGPELTKKALAVIRDPALPNKARLYAAHYMARAKVLDIDDIKFQIAESMVEENDANIKMALVLALRHTTDLEIQTTLLTQLDLEQDYRVICNLIRTLAKYDYKIVLPKILELLRSDNIHIAKTAASYLAEKGDPNDVSQYRAILRDSLPWQVKTHLYQSVIKSLPYYYTKTKNASRWNCQQDLAKETNPVAQGAYLKALGYDPENYKFIMDYIDKTEDSVLKTAGMEALGTILAHKDFNFIYQAVSRSNRRKILAYMMTGMETNDEGIVGAVANTIATPEAGLKELIDSTNFLLEAKEKLQMPGQIESVHAIENALAYLRGVNNPVLSKATNYKPTNWSLLSEYKNEVKAIVKTDKGTFTINLYLDEAPISVLNFIELSKADFYDNKIFHRVVPNFVIQTGSPRGDNYGGADYVISSEVGRLHYEDQGYVGMASAGLHTESTQWFVTHSPAPHLDGKYTIFGKISDGMNVIHEIQVGDKIIDVIITDL